VNHIYEENDLQTPALFKSSVAGQFSKFFDVCTHGENIEEMIII
jgi:hypothetical protein